MIVIQRGTSMDRPCDCDDPDISLLRVVLIGEIVRADEAILYTLAEVCATLGLLEFVDEEDSPPPPPSPPKQRSRAKLRRVK
jgi:hypothetical protein